MLKVEFGIGEWVTFKGVEGMTQINGVEVKVRNLRYLKQLITFRTSDLRLISFAGAGYTNV